MPIPGQLSQCHPVNAGLQQALHELAEGRWQNIRRDLEGYLGKNASRIVESVYFRRAVKLARVAGRPLPELVRERDAHLGYALYLAAYCILGEDATIASRDEFFEQDREIKQAIWILGEELGRPPTPDEVRVRIDRWLRESAAPQREKIVLIEQLLMWADWPACAPILWAELERRSAAGARA
jgi:hypothetical protein